MLKVKTSIHLTIKGPLLTQSSAPGKYGFDAVVARTIDDKPYIAGSHIFGKMRQALEEIESCDISAPWFNAEVKDKITGKASLDFHPFAKEVFISDFIFEGDENKQQRIRIEVDPDREAVKKGAQLFIESPFPSGKEFKFSGTVSFFIPDETVMKKYLEHIEAALRWTSQLGGYGSIGFGRLSAVDIRPVDKMTYKLKGSWPATGRTVDILVTPEFPFCIAAKQIDKNLFETERIIPGGAVLGSIATTWQQLSGVSDTAIDQLNDKDRPHLKSAFNDVTINHAFPTSDSEVRPVVPPLSLVKVGFEKGKAYYDVARCETECLVHDLAPEFRIDWKKSDDVEHDFGWPELSKEMRVRTAIDPEYRRAKESELFAYEMIVPKNIHWISRVTLPPNDFSECGSQLTSLLEHGITALGKTKTTASVKLLPTGTVTPCHASNLKQRDGLWIITLQTAALLSDPFLLQKSGARPELIKAYREAFNDISSGSLSLNHFFARQKMAGGTYLYRRFQHGKDIKGQDKPYYPWLLSTEGSVFVLAPVAGKEAEAEVCIKNWYENGLPMPGWAKERYTVQKNGSQVVGDHWSACPYIRQNGYGEIAVNLDIHWTHYPEDSIRKDINGAGEEVNVNE